MKTSHLLPCVLLAFAACKKAESKPGEPAAAKPTEAVAPAPAPKAEPTPEPTPAPVAAASPTDDQAAAALTGMLTALASGYPIKLANTFADGSTLTMEHNYPSPECGTGVMTAKDDLERQKIAACIMAADLDVAALKKAVSVKGVSHAAPHDMFDAPIAGMASGRGEVYVHAAVANGHNFDITAAVALIDGAPKLTGAYIHVELIDD